MSSKQQIFSGAKTNNSNNTNATTKTKFASDGISEPAKRLVRVIGTGIRILTVMLVVSLVDYMFLKSILNLQAVGALFSNLFFVCQLITICLCVVSTSSAELAPPTLQLIMFFSVGSLLLSFVECLRVFLDPPFYWVDALMATYFLALNLTVFAVATFARYVFSMDAWEEAIKLYGEIGSLFGQAYAKAENAVQSRAMLYFVVEMLIPAEIITLFFYFVAIGALGNGNFNFTGWIYTLHFFGVIVALVWYLRTSEFKNRTPEERELYGVYDLPPSSQSLASIYIFLFVFEVSQLIFAQGFDLTQLIVLRAFLCLISAVYVVVTALIGLKYHTPPRRISMFYALQFFLGLIATVDAFWTMTYFCYASAVRINPIFWNLSHALTLSFGIATVFVASKPLDAVAALGVVASIVACVDIVVTGRTISLEKRSDEIFVQVVFLLLSLSYIIVAAAAWPGSSDADAMGYMQLVESEKMTSDSLIQTLSKSYQTAKQVAVSGTRDAWLWAIAKRIHFLVTGPIKIVGVIEAVFIIYYTVILITGVEVGGNIQPEWYQWFYLVHFLSVFSAIIVVTLELNLKTALMFLVVMAVVCIIIDSILMAFLWDIVSEGELAIQSFFFGCDVLYLVFFAMIVHRATPEAFAYLLTIPSLSQRLYSQMSK